MDPLQKLNEYAQQKGYKDYADILVRNPTLSARGRSNPYDIAGAQSFIKDKGSVADRALNLGLITNEERNTAFAQAPGTGAWMTAQGLNEQQKQQFSSLISDQQNINPNVDINQLSQQFKANSQQLQQQTQQQLNFVRSLSGPQQVAFQKLTPQQQQQQFLQPSQQFQPQQQTQQQPAGQNIGQQPTGQQPQGGQSAYTGPSIVDYLSSVGQDSSFASRQQLAQAQGIQNYTGTAQQNTQLLNQLRSQQQGQPGQPQIGTQLGQGTPTPTQPQNYTVRAGDTLSQIAQRLGVKVSDLSGYRSGDPHKIFPGEVLTVGKKFEPTPSTDLPEPIDTGLDTGTDIDSTPEKTTPLTPAEEDYSSFLQNKSYDDFIDSFSQKLGLDGLLTEISNANAALKVVQDNKLKEIQDNNNNPWISEELRNRKNDNTEKKFEAKMRFEQENVTRAQKFYDQAREEAKFAAKLAVDQQNTNREFYYQAKQDALKAQIDALKAKGVETQVVSAGGRRLLINKQTGATIRDLGSSTSTLNVTGAGFSGTNGPDTPETPSVDTTGWDESDFSWYLDALIQSGQLD